MKRINNPYFIFVETVLILAIGTVHLIFSEFTTVTYFNTYDLFGSSPLFDFSISDNCQGKSNISFHRWGGRTRIESVLNRNLEFVSEKIAFDQTDIRMINGNYFCYKHIPYKDLLNKGQIIQKGANCPSEFIQNCGRIDTLEQELCIKETEKCPLYDLGLGNPPDIYNYIYNEKNSNVYYNNDNYNITNRKIIGRLILNEGLPCYNSSEKLWRQFSSEEALETHLKCDFEVFEKYNDSRYEQKGTITYKKLYCENLNEECLNLLYDSLTDNLEVNLYKREFLGLTKECFEKYNLNEDSYNNIHNSEESENLLLYIEGMIFSTGATSYLIAEIIYLSIRCCCPDEDEDPKIPTWVKNTIYAGFIALLIPCFICHSVFYSRIVKNDITGFDCSDTITNEVVRKGNFDLETNIIYIGINLYLELFLLVENILALIIAVYLNNRDNKKEIHQLIEQKENNKISSDFNINNEQNNSEVPLNAFNPIPS